MNSKQTIPAIAKIAPPLLIGVAAFAALKWLLTGEDEEKKPANAPANAEMESRKQAETAVFRPIPAENPAKPAIDPVYSAPAPVFPPVNLPASVAQPVIKTVAQTMPPPLKKNFVTRKIMANIFNHGARPLTRKDAVAALKRLGFGKTAAYAALTPDGRFAAWLQFAPDGIITWTDGHET